MLSPAQTLLDAGPNFLPCLLFLQAFQNILKSFHTEPRRGREMRATPPYVGRLCRKFALLDVPVRAIPDILCLRYLADDEFWSQLTGRTDFREIILPMERITVGQRKTDMCFPYAKASCVPLRFE